MSNAPPDTKEKQTYRLEKQVGYVLRLASQRHSVIFQNLISEDLTPTQFSTLIRIAEHGQASQNHLGRLAAMDVATIKGVVDRLKSKALVLSTPDPNDKRRSIISLTSKGAAIVDTLMRDGERITKETLAPLTVSEQKTLLELLGKIS